MRERKPFFTGKNMLTLSFIITACLIMKGCYERGLKEGFRTGWNHEVDASYVEIRDQYPNLKLPPPPWYKTVEDDYEQHPENVGP